jgi:hypothetical protein
MNRWGEPHPTCCLVVDAEKRNSCDPGLGMLRIPIADLRILVVLRPDERDRDDRTQRQEQPQAREISVLQGNHMCVAEQRKDEDETMDS